MDTLTLPPTPIQPPADWRAPDEQSAAAVYLANLSSPISRRTQMQALTVLTRLLTNAQHADPLTLEWWRLRYPHMAALRALLIERYAPSTVNRLLSTLRGVLREAYLLHQIDADEYQRMIAVRGVRGDRLPAGRELSEDEIARLIDACKRDKSPAGARDLALIAVLYAGGLRRAEAGDLRADDLDLRSGRIIIQRGKGNKQRAVYLAGGALAALRAWCKRRGHFSGVVFVPVRKDGVIGSGKLSATSIYNALVKRARQAEIDALTPHDLRRTHVSRLLTAGADISTVSRIVGHADPRTTARYDRRPADAMRAAAELIPFPYSLDDDPIA